MALAGLGAGLQGIGTLLDFLKKMKGRGQAPRPTADPGAGLYQPALARMGQDLTGRPSRELQDRTTDAVTRPHAAAMMEATRGIGPAAGSRIRTQGLMQQASQLAGARAGLARDADSRASRTAGTLARREVSERDKADAYSMARHGTPTEGEKGLGAISGLFGNLANLSQSGGADIDALLAKKNPGKGKQALGGLLEKLLGLLGGA